MSVASQENTTTNVTSEQTSRAFFRIVIPSLSIGWGKSKLRPKNRKNPTRKEIQKLFSDDLNRESFQDWSKS